MLALLISTAIAGPIETLDGDTVRQDGITYRLIGFDTPELNARCPQELDLAIRAKARLEQLTPRSSLIPVPCACKPGTEGTSLCNYGRSCAILSINGTNVAQTMIAEGLARTYICTDRCPRRKSWCPL